MPEKSDLVAARRLMSAVYGAALVVLAAVCVIGLGFSWWIGGWWGLLFGILGAVVVAFLAIGVTVVFGLLFAMSHDSS